MPERQRLDILLHERALAPTREKARGMIMAGEVLVDGVPVDKPGARINPNAQIVVRDRPRFVSRGGDKLAAALAAFQLDISGNVCADVGASTGGFTDCLLQNGVAKVYAIDVGYGQLDYTLRQDARVVVMERTNARFVEALPEKVNLVVLDASFISLKLLLPVIKHWLLPQATVTPLIKPQFEAGRRDVGKGGVVKDPQIHARVLREVLSFAAAQGFTIRGLIPSPLKGPAGNTEFLVWLDWGNIAENAVDIETLIQSAVAPA